MSLYDTYLEYVAPFKGSTRYHHWCGVAMIAAMLERRVWFPLGGLGKIHPNHYIVLCGGPGTGKTTNSNLAMKFIKRFNATLGPTNGGIKFGPDKVTPAALLSRMQKAAKTIKGVPKIGQIRQSALILHSTELSTLIKDIGGGSLTDDLLKLYDCDDEFRKETMKDGALVIEGPCLNLLADTTPSFLSGFLPREESGTGFTARIIFVTEFGRVDIDESVPEGNQLLEHKILAHLARIHRMSGPFDVTKDAAAFWADWFPKHRDAMFSIHDGNFMRYFYARKPVHIRKLAMVLSAARDSNRLITLDDYQRAIKMIEAIEPEMALSFGVQDYRRTPDLAKQILDMIPPNGSEISKPQLIAALMGSGMCGSILDLNNTLATLIEGRIVKIRVKDSKEFLSRTLHHA